MILCCGYALARGGAPERLAAVIILAGSLLTPLLLTSGAHNFDRLELGVMLIDIVDQALLMWLACKADRFWPIAVAGAHFLSPLAHVAKMGAVWVSPRVYGFTLALPSYLILLLIAIGAVRHQMRLKRYGRDPAWTDFSQPPGASPI